MRQVAVLFDTQPIRAACFSPNSSEYFVLGTNSKSLKFCKINQNLLTPFGVGPPNGPDSDEVDSQSGTDDTKGI